MSLRVAAFAGYNTHAAQAPAPHFGQQLKTRREGPTPPPGTPPLDPRMQDVFLSRPAGTVEGDTTPPDIGLDKAVAEQITFKDADGIWRFQTAGGVQVPKPLRGLTMLRAPVVHLNTAKNMLTIAGNDEETSNLNYEALANLLEVACQVGEEPHVVINNLMAAQLTGDDFTALRQLAEMGSDFNTPRRHPVRLYALARALSGEFDTPKDLAKTVRADVTQRKNAARNRSSLDKDQTEMDAVYAGVEKALPALGSSQGPA